MKNIKTPCFTSESSTSNVHQSVPCGSLPVAPSTTLATRRGSNRFSSRDTKLCHIWWCFKHFWPWTWKLVFPLEVLSNYCIIRHLECTVLDLALKLLQVPFHPVLGWSRTIVKVYLYSIKQDMLLKGQPFLIMPSLLRMNNTTQQKKDVFVTPEGKIKTYCDTPQG